MCLLGICKPGTEAHFFIWILSHIEFNENVKHFSTGLKFLSSLLKQAQTATSSNLIKVNTCITNDGLTFNLCVLSYFNNTVRSNLTSVFLFHLPVPTATSSVFDFIFHSAHFTPVADREIGEHFVSDTQLISQIQSPWKDSGGAGGGDGEGGRLEGRRD